MNTSTDRIEDLPSLQAYLDKASATELARRSLIGAPVYSVISLIMVFGTPFLRENAWLVISEAATLILLGFVRVLFALGFKERYERVGEKAVVQFSVLTAIQSLSLGVLAGIVIWQYWATQETVLTIVLSAGCVAAGTSALSVRHSAHLIFLACVLVPFGIAVWLVGGLAKAMLIIGFLVLMAFLVQDGGQARRIYLQRLRDHYDGQINQRRMAVEDEARRNFFADIGHEIRTPANSIIGLTSLLQEETLDERSRSFVEMIRQSSAALLKLVDNIPGSVKTRHNIRPSDKEVLDLRQCVNQAVDLYRSKAEDKGVAVEVDMASAPRSVLFNDRVHLEQVLANIMSNATKFTDQGSIRLTVSAEPGGNEDLSVHFSLSDTGSGIPDQILSNVFDPFSAGSAKTSGRYGGGGLGLPICKGLVELMEGEISLESTEGVGTTISFWVSVTPDPEDREWAQRVANPDSGSFASEHPHHILVVDDDKVQRSILCMLLSKLGYSPDEAVNGQEAIESAINGNYDRIFMDLRMPILNGLQATEKIRELKGRGDLKIIALTGDALRETRRAAMRIGMDDFIPKPVQPEVLETLLRRGSSEEEWG